jgi:polysaccharide chain length determinant protein (PEP-CTERM system associated)
VGKDSLAFRVSYVSHDPRTAQKVTERLASLYIEENLRDRENQAESTSQFLESQLEDAKRRLLEHEKKLEAYRRTYSGQLPTQLDGNLQAIQNAQLQLQSVSDSINRARERRLLIDRQLEDARTLPLPAMAQSPAAAAPDGVPSMSTGQQLEAARGRLDLFRLRYTADHPDVKALERSIRELQAKLDEEARRAPANSAPSKPLSVAESAREKRIRDLQSDLDAVDRQIAVSVADETRLKGVIAEYQAKVDLLPARESDLVELTRDYTTLQEIYGSLLKKREDSKLAANLERRQIGEQFKILDPASLPERPYNERQRLLALAGGVGGGLVLGLALVGLLEYRDSSFKSEEDVIRVLTLPVLALVPVMVSDQDREDVQRRRKRKLVVGCTATFAIACVAVIFWSMQF